MPGREDDDRLAIVRLAWRVDSLDKWRDRVEKRLDGVEEAVDGLKKADEIAQAVADKLANPTPDQPRPTVNVGGSLNWPQKIGGLVVGGLIVVDALRGLLGL